MTATRWRARSESRAGTRARETPRCVIALVVLVTCCLMRSAWAAGGLDSNGQCVGDQNGNGEVTVDELVAAVDNALNGCGLLPITLQFQAKVGEEVFACGNTYHNIGTTNVDYLPSDFRFYVYNVRLLTAAGDEVPIRLVQDGIWQLDNLALLDFENKVSPCSQGTTATNTTVRGLIQPGTYTGVRFILGVPFSRNHDDEAIAPSPLNLTGMFWSWQDGYRFLRIDGFDTAFDAFFIHLGSTGCAYGQPPVIAGCARPNRAEFTLYHFDPSTNVIVADLAALLANSDVTSNQPDSAPGCQAEATDLDCAPIFQNLGLTFSDGSPNPATQKFFRVE